MTSHYIALHHIHISQFLRCLWCVGIYIYYRIYIGHVMGAVWRYDCVVKSVETNRYDRCDRSTLNDCWRL